MDRVHERTYGQSPTKNWPWFYRMLQMIEQISPWYSNSNETNRTITFEISLEILPNTWRYSFQLFAITLQIMLTKFFSDLVPKITKKSTQKMEKMNKKRNKARKRRSKKCVAKRTEFFCELRRRCLFSCIRLLQSGERQLVGSRIVFS